jgi:16S rRNA (uracil1498-N3)-methyltransferase
MTEPENTVPRIHVAQSLAKDARPALSRAQSHYLIDVLRRKAGDPVRLFNAKDGEWLASIIASKKLATVSCEHRLREVTEPPDIDYVFAPLKHARLDYVVQKATELGARRLKPVFTQRTIVTRVNLDRLRSNVIEAAEQCNHVYVPEVCEPQTFAEALSSWDPGRGAIHCDESLPVQEPLDALKSLTLPVGLIVGPEGGFTEQERGEIRQLPFVRAISLGPRILRADTAGLAALALIQAAKGDWRA